MGLTKKMPKNKPFGKVSKLDQKINKPINQKDLKLPLWIVDGFVGILALMIYNFLLYFLTLLGVGGIIAKIEDVMGYFGLNTFLDFGLDPSEMFLGLLIIFVISFLLGVIIANIVRERKGR